MKLPILDAPAPGLRRVWNPPNPFIPGAVNWEDEPPSALQEVFEEEAKSIISKNDSPDVGFEFSLNPYRGCFHGCAYCYARPSHNYLQFGAGSDFQNKIVVKINAPDMLRKEFTSRSWKGGTLVFSGNTDCYQPLEASYGLTRKCLEVCKEFKNPVAIITKGAIIRRDIELLANMSKEMRVSVAVSVAFLDDKISKRIEPGAPRPSHRFETIRRLSEAGVTVGVGVAPVIPGLNESDIPGILDLAAQAGASSAFMTLVRLPGTVKEVFLNTIANEFPDRLNRVSNAIIELRTGKLNNSEFGERMTGSGPRWEAIRWMFNEGVRRHRLNGTKERPKMPLDTFRRPSRQLSLFD